MNTTTQRPSCAITRPVCLTSRPVSPLRYTPTAAEVDEAFNCFERDEPNLQAEAMFDDLYNTRANTVSAKVAAGTVTCIAAGGEKHNQFVTYEVASDSVPGKSYRVEVSAYTSTSCTCIDWRRHRAAGQVYTCKHMEACQRLTLRRLGRRLQLYREDAAWLKARAEKSGAPAFEKRAATFGAEIGELQSFASCPIGK